MNQVICGIYCIKNTVNNKMYIGSSYDIGSRFKAHLGKLKNDKHINKHLQSSYNKYGADKFNFSILEECNKEQLLIREQYHIDSFEWTVLYNKTKYSTGGGSDLVSTPVYLLNLKGDILNCFESGNKLAKAINISFLRYKSINTETIYSKKYRVVTVDFYNTIEGVKIIHSWPTYINATVFNKQVKSMTPYQPKYRLYKEEEEYYFETHREIAKFLDMTPEAVRQLINKTVKFHKKSGFTIALLRKIN